MVKTFRHLTQNRPIVLKVDRFAEFVGEFGWHNGQRYGLCFRHPEQLANDLAAGRSIARKIIGLDPF